MKCCRAASRTPVLLNQLPTTMAITASESGARAVLESGHPRPFRCFVASGNLIEEEVVAEVLMDLEAANTAM